MPALLETIIDIAELAIVIGATIAIIIAGVVKIHGK